MNLKRIETFIIVVIIAVIGVAFAFMQNPVVTNTPAEQNAQSQSDEQSMNQAQNTIIRYDGVEGKTALELLKTSYRVETEEFSGVGEYVVSINDVKSDSTSSFWGFYINGQQSPVGASQYITKNGDVVEWKLETIN